MLLVCYWLQLTVRVSQEDEQNDVSSSECSTSKGTDASINLWPDDKTVFFFCNYIFNTIN